MSRSSKKHQSYKQRSLTPNSGRKQTLTSLTPPSDTTTKKIYDVTGIHDDEEIPGTPEFILKARGTTGGLKSEPVFTELPGCIDCRYNFPMTVACKNCGTLVCCDRCLSSKAIYCGHCSSGPTTTCFLRIRGLWKPFK